MKKRDYDVSVFYFPNFHYDKRNEIWHGKGWNEWNLMRAAGPRFPGHPMPKVPLWGYENEADPIVMEKKIQAAVDHGITNFIFDWYWYSDGLFLEKALDEGFLGAKNKNSINFSLMWANHNWTEAHPISRMFRDNHLLVWKMTEEQFFDAVRYMINTYFCCPNYYKLDGKLFFSIYELNTFVNNFGGIENAKKILSKFRAAVRAAGLGELHISGVVWGVKILTSESESTANGDKLKDLGLDSVMSYVWIHEHWPQHFPMTEYSEYRKICESDFDKLSNKFGLPYYPNVTAGWDNSPRTIQSDMWEDIGSPFSPVLVNNTPAEFQKALEHVKTVLDKSNLKTKMFTINAWNEWTEGSYIEPDTESGYGRLEAIKKVFKDANK